MHRRLSPLTCSVKEPEGWFTARCSNTGGPHCPHCPCTRQPEGVGHLPRHLLATLDEVTGRRRSSRRPGSAQHTLASLAVWMPVSALATSSRGDRRGDELNGNRRCLHDAGRKRPAPCTSGPPR